MPLSRMESTTFAMPSIIDSHDMGLRTVLQSRRPKEKTPIQHTYARTSGATVDPPRRGTDEHEVQSPHLSFVRKIGCKECQFKYRPRHLSADQNSEVRHK
ncbi:hypothetical protein TNCV_2370291 [Trichonephila clavipes]|nr:hypothetical protein TNCV_2370291 [Trichonephila clavipes]